MFRCTHCPASFPTQFLLDDHYRRDHQGTQGWFEPGSPQVNSNGKLELKSIEHQIASAREKMQKERPIANPVPAPLQPRPKEELNIPNGWLKTTDGYIYEHEIFSQHTTENVTTGVLHATLNNHYIKCLLHTYDKDLSEIARLHEKEAILDGRLASFVPSDPAFPQIANELHKVKSEITYLTKTLRPEEQHHLIFEETSKFEANSGENTKWQSDMMQRVLSEAERLKGNYQRQHESDSK